MIALFSFTIFGSVEAINDAAHILSVTDSVLDLSLIHILYP